MKNKSAGIRVQLNQAEKMRKYLSEKKLLRNDLKISKNNAFIFFPVKEIPNELNPYNFVKKEFEKKVIKPKSYKEIGLIPEKLKHELPTSYDVIGDIILIKLPNNLLKYQKEIGKSLLKSNKNIRTVCSIKPVTGEFRTRNITVIAGESRTTTTHKEYGLKLNVNIKNTYFSPRLAAERKRVAELVKPGEIIVDLFTGVAPFSIMIAKYADPKIIYAIDKNKEAVLFAKQNIKKNNVLNKIEVINADAKEIHDILEKKADRIIMNLPFSAHLFFTYALKIAKTHTIIHYYDILKENKIEDKTDKLKKIAEENRYVLTNLDVRKIKTYAPREFYIRIDITAKKMPM
ncbi:MAG: class I SAM-dependent methyltransferase family protein [Thermoplasmatales archaeon]|nr:MAG: class I SAM-dependent methyltransferase family protein [Thermoplasmatales archaeon]